MLPLLLWYHRNPALSRTLSLQPSLVWPFTGLPLPLGLEGSGWELEVWGIAVLFSPSGCFQTTSPPFLHPSSQCQTIFSATVQPFMDSWVLPTPLPFKKKKNFISTFTVILWSNSWFQYPSELLITRPHASLTCTSPIIMPSLLNSCSAPMDLL